MRRAGRNLAAVALAFALAGALLMSASTAAAEPSPILARIVAEFDRYARETDPVSAGLDGDRAALVRWPDNSTAAAARRRTQLEDFRLRLAALGGRALDPEDALNRDDLAWTVEDAIEGLAFDTARIPFSSDSGPFDTADYVARSTAIHDRADAEAWLARLGALPAYYDREMANVRRGLDTGFVLPRQIALRVAEQVGPQAEQAPADSVLLEPLRTLPSTLTAADQAALRAQALRIVAEEVKPKERAYAALLRDEYLPKARGSLAARSLPDGERYYAWLARHYTTTAMTPDQIHALGEAEVARIRARMEATIAETGFNGGFEAFLAFLRTDPRFYATSRTQLLEKASEIAKRIDGQLPRWFGTLPRLSYGVIEVPRDIEENYTTGRYFPGSPQQGVAGRYVVNTSHLDQRALYELPALTLHEAVPGHHLQIALAQELGDLPYFRRNSDITAYVEGWGLYAESLGEEMGIYRDPYERFGRLSYEMWRACRLVADTGVHWLGWTRAEARECFIRNSALSEKNIDVELDRYISWPGQALAYKVGELKLQALRRRAQDGLGTRFDIRSFHDEVLRSGPLPLDLLDRRVGSWISAQKSRWTSGLGVD